MEPKVNYKRRIDFTGNTIDTIPLKATDIDNITLETGSTSFLASENFSQETMGDEKIKIKALEQSINMAKLFTNVTPGNIIKMAAKLAIYIKG